MSKKSKNNGISYDTKTLIVILLLVLAYPIGWLFMLLWMRWRIWVKLLVSIPVFIFLLGMSLVAWNPAGRLQEEKCSQQCINAENQNVCTFVCMQQYKQSKGEVIQQTAFYDLSKITLTDMDMTGRDYNKQYPVFTASIHNTSQYAAKNIEIKITFYNDDPFANPDLIPQDTQYIQGADYLSGGDSKTLRGYITTSFDTFKKFWWKAEVSSALQAI